MSVQWTFIAGYLYFEIAVVILMMLPIFSPRRWHQFFKSRLFSMFQSHIGVYFYIFLGILGVFLLDAIREMRKYAHSGDSHVHLTSEMKGNVKLFRAQRNFYITSFAIFLTFVIRRLITMLIIQDELRLKAEAIIRQADDTVRLAKDTVLASTIRASQSQSYEDMKNDMENALASLEEEKEKTKELENEVRKWKSKYEEIVSNGQGDK
ncbi:B-cell receptor-associated protein 31-like [Achroia grisella]|uniref:B-cell receptor-associated protein 31-like n=1 Tax=Achroia grisella TaxID=688607 RepID=UPI0027D2BFCD|nr:B-cell receptor-associated protein 31-like [Achroia grisella]